MKRHRRAQDAVRDQLVAAARAQSPRRRRRTTAIVALFGTLLGATAVAEATRRFAVGEPIESLLPPDERETFARYRAPHGLMLVATAPDPDHRYRWGVGIYTTAKGEDCVLAGQVLGTRLGRDRDGRFHPYGPDVTGACGRLDRLDLMTDLLRVDGPHPRTVLFGRVSDPGRRLTYAYRGERRTVRPARGGAFLLVFDGRLDPAELELIR